MVSFAFAFLDSFNEVRNFKNIIAMSVALHRI